VEKVTTLFVYGAQQSVLDGARAVEVGKRVARDIGGGDPERMAPLRVAEYCQAVFAGTCIKMTVDTDRAFLEKNYPLLMAVARCSMVVERHWPCVIHLEYVPEGDVEETVFLVGKGVTYDTGGLDIKAGGIMAGMHRDKCGAAAVAGIMRALAESKPKGVRVVGRLAMVRNSCGADGYVADEVILSRAGRRVRVVNTDAEGRMAMGDVLCLAKEDALTAVNPRIMTVATLTGHAIRAYGEGYNIVVDNAAATAAGIASRFVAAGDAMADPFEVSTLRREDWDMIKPKYGTEDVVQCNTAASSATARGHQFPAAFLQAASGLDDHQLCNDKPLAYSHLDIAGAALMHPKKPSASPVAAFMAAFGRA
jgi:leucyl aminopeptidase